MKDEVKKSDVLIQVIAKIGSMSEIARMFDLTPQAVQQWSVVPLDYALPLSKACEIPLELFHKQKTESLQ